MGIELNYWASVIARDEMPEPVAINLDSDGGDSLTDTASQNEDNKNVSFCMKLLTKYKTEQIRNEEKDKNIQRK